MVGVVIGMILIVLAVVHGIAAMTDPDTFFRAVVLGIGAIELTGGILLVGYGMERYDRRRLKLTQISEGLPDRDWPEVLEARSVVEREFGSVLDALMLMRDQARDELDTLELEAESLRVDRQITLVVLGIYSRALTYLDCVRVLAERGYGEEALGLARSIYESEVDAYLLFTKPCLLGPLLRLRVLPALLSGLSYRSRREVSGAGGRRAPGALAPGVEGSCSNTEAGPAPRFRRFRPANSG